MCLCGLPREHKEERDHEQREDHNGTENIAKGEIGHVGYVSHLLSLTKLDDSVVPWSAQYLLEATHRLNVLMSISDLANHWQIDASLTVNKHALNKTTGQ